MNYVRALSISIGICFLVFQSPHLWSQSQAALSSLPRRLSLAQAESLLIDRNLNVLAAKYQVDANRAARLIAAYKPNPVLTVGAEQLPFYSPIAGSYPRFFSTNADAGANPVYTMRLDTIVERGGKRELRTTAAEEQLQAAEAQVADAIRTELFQLRRSFATATLARENVKLAETVEQQYSQTEKLTLAKVDQGDIARVEMYRVGAGRLQYQQAVLQARTAYVSAVHDVVNSLGERDDNVETLELTGDFDERPLPHTLNELRAMALERPDVVAARHLLSAAQSTTQLARAQRTRDVDIGYEYQRAGSDHTAGVLVSVPLFIRNDQRALATQAEASQRLAEARLKQAELQASTDVEKAYQTYFSVRRVLDLYGTQNLTQLDRLRTIANVSYTEGASSLLELLDAQRAYTTAMTAYNQARSDYQVAVWELEQAVGQPLQSGE
jgi:cobalt-zinc-cadmium efflux system outer membrane protein